MHHYHLPQLLSARLFQFRKQNGIYPGKKKRGKEEEEGERNVDPHPFYSSSWAQRTRGILYYKTCMSNKKFLLRPKKNEKQKISTKRKTKIKKFQACMVWHLFQLEKKKTKKDIRVMAYI